MIREGYYALVGGLARVGATPYRATGWEWYAHWSLKCARKTFFFFSSIWCWFVHSGSEIR